MKRFLLLLFGIIVVQQLYGQTQSNDSCTKLSINGNTVKWTELGKTRIYLKDGTIKTRCTIHEVRRLFVLYEKDGVLHDLSIDRINHIEVTEQSRMVYFESDHRLKIR
jgi:hypothetical protein